MTFKEGDHVQLKTGGVEMIVTRIEKIGELTVVYCVWIDEDHQVQRTCAAAAAPGDWIPQ